MQVADRPLASLALAPGAAPRLAAVGCTGGTVSVLQLSEGLVEQQDNEKGAISAVGWEAHGQGLCQGGKASCWAPADACSLRGMHLLRGTHCSLFSIIVPACMKPQAAPACLHPTLPSDARARVQP